MEFYRDVFGARVVDVTRMPGSDLVAHAMLNFGTGMLTLSDPMESYGLVAGDPATGTRTSPRRKAPGGSPTGPRPSRPDRRPRDLSSSTLAQSRSWNGGHVGERCISMSLTGPIRRRIGAAILERAIGQACSGTSDGSLSARYRG